MADEEIAANVPSVPKSRHQRSRTACKQCRQAKVKCGMISVSRNGSHQYTPCVRCRRLGYECEWKPDFRRTNNVTRVHHIEQQLLALQAQQPQQQQTPSHPDLGVSGSRRGSVHAPTTPQLAHGTEAITQPGDTFSVRDVQISAQEAEILFDAFFDKYHVHLPFIHRPSDAGNLHRTCELLFWTTLSIGARHRALSTELIPRLSPYLTESLGTIVVGAPKHWQIGHIQAVLLMSLYLPFSSTSFFGDRSVALVSIALTSAMYLGLHCPGHESEYGSLALPSTSAAQEERLATWAASVAVAQNHATDFGMPVHIPFDNRAIEDLCNGIDGAVAQIADDLRHYLLIQRKSFTAFSALPRMPCSGDDDNDFARILARETIACDGLDVRIAGLSSLNRLRLKSMKMNLQSMWFQLSYVHPAQKEGVLSAYRTAIEVVTDAIAEDSILSHSPRTTFRMLHHSACIIFKVLHSSYGSSVDYDHGKVMFNACLLCMQQQAVQIRADHNDLPIRSAQVLRSLWQLGEQHPEMKSLPPELAIWTRMSASVDYDCLAIYFNRVEQLRQDRQNSQKRDATDRPRNVDVDLNLDDWHDSTINLADFNLDLPWPEDGGYRDIYNFL